MNFRLDYLLNLPGVTVERCAHINGAVHLALRNISSGMACPHCGQYTEDLHQDRPILVRDLPAFGQSIYLNVPRRQFYCPNCQRYSTEALNFVGWKRHHTRRYEDYICHLIQLMTLEQIAQKEGLSQGEVSRIINCGRPE